MVLCEESVAVVYPEPYSINKTDLVLFVALELVVFRFLFIAS